jgi:hypothetical protein
MNKKTQNIEGNKGETKKSRTMELSKDVNDYDTGEYT